MHIMKSSSHKILIISFVIVFLLAYFPTPKANGVDNLSLTYYGQWGCPTCHEKYELIESFVNTYPEINATYLWIPYNISITDYYNILEALGEISPPPPPAVVLNRSNEILVIYTVDINVETLEAWRLGGAPEITEFTIWIAFITGLVAGLSACMLLLLSVLGTSLTMVETRGKYFIISLGLILGLICAYVIVSILFLVLINALSLITYLKYIFGGILLFIGIWQIVEFKKENSTIFGTPQQIKSLLKDFIEKRSGLYALLIGIIFAFIKIPCFGAPYLQLIFVSQNDPLLIFLILFYFLGMLLPIIGVLVALRIGFQSDKINKFRSEYRPYLRLLSGVFIITLTLYLFLDVYISIEILLWLILCEILIFVLMIWLRTRKVKQNQEPSN